MSIFSLSDRLLGLSGEGVRLESGRSWVRIPLAAGFFRGRVIPVTSKLALEWLPSQATGVLGSVLGLVGPVFVYCDWLRWKVWSATSISVWHHVKLSGVLGSVLGLVGPVLAYCEWVRWKVWSATSISVWQHVKLSEQIHP